MKTVLRFLCNAFTWIIRKLHEVIKKYPELLSIPIGFILWTLIKIGLKTNPENAPLDDGIFMIIPFTFIQFTIYISLAWMFLGIIFGTFRRYMQADMKADFINLTKWQKIKISYAIFFALLYAIVVLSTSLL